MHAMIMRALKRALDLKILTPGKGLPP
jgi:hypothetical protein